MYLYDEVNKIESEEEEDPIPRARFPEKYKVQHKTEIGMLVYEIMGKNAPALIYKECFNFQSEMLSKGYQWHFIRAKLKDALSWIAKKSANHSALKTILKRISEKQ